MLLLLIWCSTSPRLGTFPTEFWPEHCKPFPPKYKFSEVPWCCLCPLLFVELSERSVIVFVSSSFNGISECEAAWWRIKEVLGHLDEFLAQEAMNNGLTPGNNLQDLRCKCSRIRTAYDLNATAAILEFSTWSANLHVLVNSLSKFFQALLGSSFQVFQNVFKVSVFAEV